MHAVHEDPIVSVRQDLEDSDASGAPPLGHLVGLHRASTTDGSYALRLDPDRPALAGGPGILELAMLADLALGGAIRNQVGLTLPMPTLSMTIQLAAGRTADVRRATGACTVWLGRTATATSQLFSADGEVLGDAVGVFALPRLPYDGPGRAMPWDQLSGGRRTGSGTRHNPVDEDRTRLVEAIGAHAAGSPTVAWGTQQVADRLLQTGGGHRLDPTASMVNRLGHVQGGVLFTSAVLAAARTAELEPGTMTSATIEFLEAAHLHAPLTHHVTILRTGGRSSFTSTLLVQDERPRTHLSAVFRR